MNPPLRGKDDVLALIEGIKSGVIDIIATDHAPHHKDEKFVEFDLAAFGIIGLQTVVPLTLNLVRSGHITIQDFVRLTSYRPAQILRLTDRGEIKTDKLADIAIIDPDFSYTFDKRINKSKSENTPLFNKELIGIVKMTIKNGKIVYKAL
jgi:dihydroorotase